MRIWKTVFDPIQSITHPEYDAALTDWVKFRKTFAGGKQFVDKYLERFSHREDWSDFRDRKRLSYCPAHAKAAVMDIKNAIYQRMVDILRKNGANSYTAAVEGEDNGVDFHGNSMTGFIGRLILPELLSMAKVGIYIDKGEVPADATKSETDEVRPYIYMYKAEAIRSWAVDQKGAFTSLLLEDYNEVTDPITGLTKGKQKSFRLLRLLDAGLGVRVTFYKPNGDEITEKAKVLQLKRIPFVIAELSQSLLTDVADYQIALVNIASSDVNYTLKSNFPFYTEQFDIMSDMSHLRQAVMDTSGADGANTTKDGEAAQAAKAKSPEIESGTSQGRRYPKGLERPGFIHPSPEPLIASMQKQDQLKAEIRQLVNLSVSALQPTKSSAESKKEDGKGLEAGLSYIGMELQYTEEQIASIWNEYEAFDGETKVTYPSNYSLKTDEDRQREAEANIKLIPNIPSLSYQKEIAKETITTMVGHKVTSEELGTMHAEIDDAEVIVIDPDIIAQDIEGGLVTVKTASVARLYPEGEAERAKVEHAERIKRIQLAQTDPAARGLDDQSAEPTATKDDKAASRLTDFDDKVTDKTRGDAQIRQGEMHNE